MQKVLRLLILIGLLFAITTGQRDRVKLRDVKTITLTDGYMTASRTARPVPQLRCVGSVCKSAYRPSSVQCYNRGFDGRDVQWECKGSLPKGVYFGRLSVNCEGYDSPNDPYVVVGSCGLEYELRTSSGREESTHRQDSELSDALLAIFGFVGLVVFLCVMCCFGSTKENVAAAPSAPPPPYAESVPQYGWTTPQQSAYTSSNTASSDQGGWASFLSGATLGGLGGYAAGRSSSGTSYRRSPSPVRHRRRSPSPDHHQATGFASTSRR